MFNLVPESQAEHPSDVLNDTRAALSALTELIGRADADVFEIDDTRDGLYVLLGGIVATLADVTAIVVKRIEDPHRDGYRKGIADANEHYRRGVREGLGEAERLRSEVAELTKRLTDGGAQTR